MTTLDVLNTLIWDDIAYRAHIPPVPSLVWLDYLGWRYRWTGFKGAREDDLLHGQWIAIPPTDRADRLVVCVPDGQEGSYQVGDAFQLGKGLDLNVLNRPFAEVAYQIPTLVEERRQRLLTLIRGVTEAMAVRVGEESGVSV